jgi:hypothetical protein
MPLRNKLTTTQIIWFDKIAVAKKNTVRSNYILNILMFFAGLGFY